MPTKLKNEGIVGAGTLVPFPVPKHEDIVYLTPEQDKNAHLYGTLTVSGDSLKDVGIFDGDTLICKKAFSKREIDYDTICIVYLPNTGELIAKQIVFKGDHILLRSCNKKYPDKSASVNEVDIRGVVIGFQRMTKHFSRVVDEIPF